MECVGNFKAFNYSVLQIVSNSEYEHKELFSENEYKLVSCSHAIEMSEERADASEEAPENKQNDYAKDETKPEHQMMPPEYSTGVYGAYELKRVHRYRPSVSTGVYGMYMVQPLGMTQYKIQKERKENKEDCLTEIVFKYDDKIIVSNSTA
eukprot:111497_1